MFIRMNVLSHPVVLKRIEWNKSVTGTYIFLEQRFMRYHPTSSGNYHVTKTAGQLPDDVQWYRMKRCSKKM